MPVADLVVRSPHSLLHQCTAARFQSSGCENPDGWGIGWYVDGVPDPYRYRTATPMPLDHDGVAALDGLESHRFVAHVRHKSPGSPTEVAGNAPFVSGRWLFAHNGFVEGFREGRRDQLFADLSPARQETLAGDADSELIFGLILDRLDAGVRCADRARRGARAARGHGRQATTSCSPTASGSWPPASATPSSSARPTGRRRPPPTTEIVSEPYDDALVARLGDDTPGEWQQLADGTLVELDDEDGSQTSDLFQGATR